MLCTKTAYTAELWARLPITITIQNNHNNPNLDPLKWQFFAIATRVKFRGP